MKINYTSSFLNVCMLCLVLFFISFCGLAQTPVTVTLNPVADTELWSGSANTNYGGSTTLDVYRQGTDRARMIMRFDLSSIPSNADITGATLRVFKTNTSSGTNIGAHRMTSSWVENSATWNNSSGSTSWNSGSGGDFIASPESTNSTAIGSTGFKNWSIANMVQGWVSNPSNNFGVLLELVGDNSSDFRFSSRQGSNPPQLVVTYIPCSVSATINTQNVTCDSFPDFTGSINLTNPTGASQENYQYRLDSGAWQTSPNFENLAPATYQVSIRDANDTGCSLSLGNATILSSIDLSADRDGDGVPDACDLDSDNDGILDIDEGFFGLSELMGMEATRVNNSNATFNFNASDNVVSGTYTSTGNSFGRSEDAVILRESDGNKNFDWQITSTGEYSNSLFLEVIFVQGKLWTSHQGRNRIGNFRLTLRNGQVISNPNVTLTQNIPGFPNQATADTNNNDQLAETTINGNKYYGDATIGTPQGSGYLVLTNQVKQQIIDGGGVVRIRFDQVTNVTADLVSRLSFIGRIYDFIDTDKDGIPDFVDLDSDNDGIYDAIEAGADPSDVGPNGRLIGGVDTNGVPLAASGGFTPLDTDNDGLANFRDLDSDGDGCSDANEYYGNLNTDGTFDNPSDDLAFGPQATRTIDAEGRVEQAEYEGDYAPVIDSSRNEGCTNFCPGGFITTWDTTNPGTSNNNQITLPTTGGGYDYQVFWTKVDDPETRELVLEEVCQTFENDGVIIDSNLISSDNSGASFLNNGNNSNGAWMNNTNHFMVIDLGQVYDPGAQVSVRYKFSNPGVRTFVTSQIPNGTYNSSGGSNPFSISFTGDTSFSNYTYTITNATRYIQIDMTERDEGRVEIIEVSVEEEICTITNFTGPATITFPTPGIYQVEVCGDFPQMFFDNGNTNTNGGDKEKILSVEQWGDQVWRNMARAFWGASNLVINVTDAPDLSEVTNMNFMFRGATSFNQNINHWDVSNVQLMNEVFRGATSFNQSLNDWDVSNVGSFIGMFADASSFNRPLNNWNTSNATNFSNMFLNSTSFNQDLGAWDISSIDNALNMLNNSGLDVENYDATLIGWGDQSADVNSNVTVGAEGLTFCYGDLGRDELINNNGWTFVGDTGC
ncbi:MAG: BspA family leucine-rich repeat surface protein, partial [Flavobacteriaceae bacterium]|nr:BspA family leucine-rich repeat surface protein [Flavobacteriaceae bacterium]